MMKPSEAYRLLGAERALSRKTFYDGLNRNEIPNRRVGRRFLIPRTAFLQWLQGTDLAGATAGR